MDDITDGLVGVGGFSSHDRGRLDRDDHKGLAIHFVHVATGETCHFKAFLTEFNDQYASEWNERKTFGRMDPISTFQRTGRKITLGWDCPAASEQEAIINLREAEKFISMLYPVFEEAGENYYQVSQAKDYQESVENIVGGFETGPDGEVLSETEREIANILRSRSQSQILSATQVPSQKSVSSVMVAPPLMKLKLANLIMEPGARGILEDAVVNGLVGTVSGLSYSPDIENGFFGATHPRIPSGGDPLFKDSLLNGKTGFLVPQTLKFSIEFTVHHTHKIGFRRKQKDDLSHGGGSHKASRFGHKSGFPYNSSEID